MQIIVQASTRSTLAYNNIHRERNARRNTGIKNGP